MEAFLIILLLGAFLIWLVRYFVRTSDRLDQLEQRVKSLHTEIRDLRKEASPDSPPVPETSLGKAIQQRAERSTPEPETKPGSEIGPETEPVAKAPIHSAPTPPPLPQAPRPIERPSEPSVVSPPPVPPQPSPVPRPAEPAFDWRAFLERIYLWPPSGANAEATIGAWWLTRIGLIVFIIAAVFFGIRIAQDVPPWMRVASLAAIAIAVTALGNWLERRLTAFGRLIAAGGLGLGYFTAYAAYGIDATRIITDPTAGFFAQAAAVGIVIGWSLWKKDETIGAMSILLGYVACWFSYWHDLEHFMIVGLLFLATGAGVLHWARHWRWPLTVATAGSWIGFFILAVFEWPREGHAPALPLILGSLAGLTAILEAANFFAQERYGETESSHPRWRRWLAILNTSLAVAVGWLAIRLAYPGSVEAGEEDAFFMVFAVLIGLFAALRFWRKHPTGLTEAYFLKAAGLVALFVVEYFDGPTRWLSLSAQTLILLWAWQHSRLKWIEAGFAVLLVATLGVFWHDVVETVRTPWEMFGIRHLIGALSLALLSAGLALHARWSDSDESSGPKNTLDGLLTDLDPRAVIRFILALAVGFGAVPLVMNPSPEALTPKPVLLLSLIALVIAVPAVAWRRFPSVAAGLSALLPALVGYLGYGDRTTVSDPPLLWTGAWLTLLGFGLAELALRFWRDRWVLGNGIRLILQAFGVVILAVTLHRLIEFNGEPAWLSLVGLAGFSAASVWALFRQSVSFPAEHFSGNRATSTLIQWLLAAVIGFSSWTVADDLLRHHPYGASCLSIAAAVLFGAAFLTRNAVPALAGGIPLLTAVGFHLDRFRGAGTEFAQHLLAACLIMAVCLGTAWVLWKRVDAAKHPAASGFDLVLHALTLLLLHWIYRTHLDISGTFLADAVTALGVIAIHRRFPFRTLAAVSFLPVGLGLLHLLTGIGQPLEWGNRWPWWPAAAVLFAWLWLGHRWFVRPEGQPLNRTSRVTAYILHEGMAAAALTVAGYHSIDNPWFLAPLAAFGLGLAAMGRLGGLVSSLWWSILPLATSVIAMMLRIIGAIDAPPMTTLAAFSLACALIVAHGIVVTWRLRGPIRSLVWIHAAAALGILFLAFEADRFGVVSLTTVCWGIAAVVLFAVGFAAGLRPYRLAGLIGLAFAMMRMFLVDIDDALYRIYAFFVIALVLLGMGYLYHRFRHLIERADRNGTVSPERKPDIAAD